MATATATAAAAGAAATNGVVDETLPLRDSFGRPRCLTPRVNYFPFPCDLTPKSWNVKENEYVVPDDVMSSMYSEFDVYQKNTLRVKLARRLQLDYHQKEIVIFNDDEVVFRTSGYNFIRSNPNPKDPTGLRMVIRGEDPYVAIYCQSNEQRAQIARELDHFRQVLTEEAARQQSQKKQQQQQHQQQQATTTQAQTQDQQH